MIKINKLTFGILCSVFVSMFVACSSHDDIIDDLQKDENPGQPHTCELVLNVTKSGFDDEPKSRAATSWTSGDKIYLTFTVENGTSYGDATYNNGTWTLNYYGSLTEGTTTKCTAVYFDNPEYESGSVVKISENTGIYEDTNGSYVFNGSTLSVMADLKPKTGRIRFAGNNNDEITLYGISHYTSYDCSNGKFSNSIEAFKSKVTSGYTPYIYGYFADADQHRLNVITAASGYTRQLASSIYQPGESGYMSIPTETSHNGWQNSLIFKVNDVDFTMIPVAYANGNFFLAETETTEQLYKAITGGAATSSKLPKINVSQNDWSAFLSTLNALTGLNFRLPTLNEWQYAYSGGNKSQGYTYSGSNVLSNVAWCWGNSNNKRHEVKQLQPNELGFYDMCGNVSECVSNATYIFYGGFYNSDEADCLKTAGTFSSAYGGLRIALSNK